MGWTRLLQVALSRFGKPLSREKLKGDPGHAGNACVCDDDDHTVGYFRGIKPRRHVRQGRQPPYVFAAPACCPFFAPCSKSRPFLVSLSGFSQEPATKPYRLAYRCSSFLVFCEDCEDCKRNLRRTREDIRTRVYAYYRQIKREGQGVRPLSLRHVATADNMGRFDERRRRR